MDKTTNIKTISENLSNEINELAIKYVNNDIRAFEMIFKRMTDSRIYRNTTDQQGNTEDYYGNVWKKHSIYNGWLKVSKNKQDGRIADGIFVEALVEAVKKYDVSKGAEFTSYFCFILFKRMMTHFKELNDRNKLIGVSLNSTIKDDSELRVGDLLVDESMNVVTEESIKPHIVIKLGRGLIKNLQEFMNRKKNKRLSVKQCYFKTFYTLDTCAVVRLETVKTYKSITNYEHEIVDAIDYEIMHNLYTKPCATFLEVVVAKDKYPDNIYKEKKENEKPGMYHDIVITFIKKTNRGTPIKKEQVSKYRGIYNSIVDGIVTSIKSAQTELYA